jgi:predicted CopG family antitoxin
LTSHFWTARWFQGLSRDEGFNLADQDVDGLGDPVHVLETGNHKSGEVSVGGAPGILHRDHAKNVYTEITDTESVSTKTISLAEDAYEALSAMKRPGESFTDIVRRLTRKRSLADLTGVMEARDANAVAAAIEANRKQRLAERKRSLGLS